MSTEAVDETLTMSDNNSNITLKVGGTLSIELDSNPSTGYSWQVNSGYDEDVLQPVGDSQFSLDGKTPVPGRGGTQTFQFKAIGKGETTLTLVYVRPWETSVTPTPNNIFTTNVTVE